MSNVGEKFPSDKRVPSLYSCHFKSFVRRSQSISVSLKATSYIVFFGLLSTPLTLNLTFTTLSSVMLAPAVVTVLSSIGSILFVLTTLEVLDELS